MSLGPCCLRWSLVLFLASSTLSCAGGAQSSETPLPDQAPLSLFPGSLRQVNSHYPASVSLVIAQKNCNSDAPGATAFDPAKPVKVDVAAPGMHVSDATAVSPCKVIGTLALDAAAVVSGYFVVNLTQESRDKGFGVINLVDGAAGAFPTPNQQVDVIWGVQSKSICKANYGRNISSKVYCVEVKIGNNTGHQLELAGIGFESYTKIEILDALLQPSGKQQNGASAADHTSKIDISVTTPNIGYQSIRAASLDGNIWDTRNILYNFPSAAGILMASFNPFFHAANNVARWTAGTAVLGTAVPAAVDRVAGDPTIRHLNALDDQAFRDGKLIPNNTQIRTIVFVDRKAFTGFGGQQYLSTCTKLYLGNETATKKCQKSGDDPTAVKVGLGKLRIVGDLVEFMQRVVVDSTVTSQEVAAGPKVVSAGAMDGGKEVTVAVSGVAARGVTATISETGTNKETSLTPKSDDLVNGKFVFEAPEALDQKKSYTITVTTPNLQKLGPTKLDISPKVETSPKSDSSSPKPDSSTEPQAQPK